MTTDPMRFSEQYDPPPRETPDASELHESVVVWASVAGRLIRFLNDNQIANPGDEDPEYDEWLDTLDHHTVGECDCAECACGEDVAA